MTLTNTIAAKLFGAFVAVAMVFMLSVPAQAQTAEELQQLINDLLAQVASLQSQLGQSGGSMAAGVCPYTWTRDLNMGATGADVMKLQQFLNSDAETRVAATGVGSAGQETEYYGSLTGAAVAKFQTKNRSDILTPLGLVNATTYFGPSTRAKANSLCATAMADDTADDMADDTADMADDDGGGPLSGEASLQDFDVRDGEDTDIEEGQNDAPVGEFRVEFNDGDAKITRIDVALVADGANDEADPWDTFEDVSLWIDGDKVAEKNADDKDDYLDEDDGSLRFSGLNIVGREDDRVDIVVGVSVQSSVNGADDGEDWQLFADAVRYIDADDVTTTDNDTDDLNGQGNGVAADFSIEEEGGDDELVIRSSNSDPDSTTFPVDDTDDSDWTTIFAFNLDTDDSVNDITVDGLVISVVIASTTVNVEDVVNDMQLLIDGDIYDDYTQAGEGTATSTFDFDTSDDDLSIDAGDEVTVEVQVEFQGLTNNYGEGLQFYASTTAANLDAEGADDLSFADGQLTGSQQSETHTLRTEGVILEPGDFDTEYIENDDQSTTDNEGEFTLEFDVTAFETDVYVNPTAASGTAMGTLGANFLVTTGGVTAQVDGISADLNSTADEEGSGRFKVSEGETETFTLTVVFDPEATGFHRVRLYSINWASTDDDPTTQQLALPAADYRTTSLDI